MKSMSVLSIFNQVELCVSGKILYNALVSTLNLENFAWFILVLNKHNFTSPKHVNMNKNVYTGNIKTVKEDWKPTKPLSALGG